MGIILLLKNLHRNRPFIGPRRRRPPIPLTHETGKVGIADVEIDIDGVNLAQGSKDRDLARTDEVAGVDESPVYSAGEGRPHFRIAKVKPSTTPWQPWLRRGSPWLHPSGISNYPDRSDQPHSVRAVLCNDQIRRSVFKLGLLLQHQLLRLAPGSTGKYSAESRRATVLL